MTQATPDAGKTPADKGKEKGNSEKPSAIPTVPDPVDLTNPFNPLSPLNPCNPLNPLNL